ncbi:hypothetical protein [Hanstruepera ponticola]|uniref:hypothetical protein n=1 Tax=Hanstruepera ponticola TaxID=2042995 RepID=UPI00177C7B93|nr:hypothetical protein [Hanstruepera ponticola]
MKILKTVTTFLILFFVLVINAQAKKVPNYFGEDTMMTLTEKHEFNKVFYVDSYKIIVVQQIYINVSGKDQRVIHFGIDANENGVLEVDEATNTEYADLNYSSNLQKPLYLGSMENDKYIQDFYLIHQSYEDGVGSSFSVVEYNGYDSDENGEISENEKNEDREFHYQERNGFTGWGS